MNKQRVIVEDPEKVMGKDWRIWKQGIEDLNHGQFSETSTFSDPSDQRAFDKFRSYLKKK